MPVGARYSPKRLRSASDHSPVVTPACAARIEAGITLAPEASASSRPRSAACTSAALRRLRKARSDSICARSADSSTTSTDCAPVTSGEGSLSVKAFTPTTICSPLSIARMRCVCEATSWRFM